MIHSESRVKSVNDLILQHLSSSSNKLRIQPLGSLCRCAQEGLHKLSKLQVDKYIRINSWCITVSGRDIRRLTRELDVEIPVGDKRPCAKERTVEAGQN